MVGIMVVVTALFFFIVDWIRASGMTQFLLKLGPEGRGS